MGSDAGGERAATYYSLIGTAKLNGLDPQASLRCVFEHIAEHPINRIEELLPWTVDNRARSGAERGGLSPVEPLNHIRALIDNGGHIMVGRVDPIAFAAIAWDGRQAVAMLQCRNNETLPDLLQRLDLAIDSAKRQGRRVDEVN